MAKTINQIADNLFSEKDSLTKEEFVKAVEASSMKIADLSDGDFVMKTKYDTLNEKHTKLQKDYETLKNNPEPDEATKKRIADLEAERDGFKRQFEETTAKVTKGERLAILKKQNVHDDFAEFVLDQVSKEVTDTVDFETASKKYLKDHAQYCVSSEDKPSGFPLGNNPPTTGGKFAVLNDFLKG